MLYYHTVYRTQLHPSNMMSGEMSDRVDLFSRWNCQLDIYLPTCLFPARHLSAVLESRQVSAEWVASPVKQLPTPADIE